MTIISSPFNDFNLENSNFAINPDHAIYMFKKMQWLLHKERFCDVTLIIGKDKKRILAHELVLASASELIARSIYSCFYQKDKDETYHIELADLKYDNVETLVKYCYTGLLDCNNGLDVEGLCKTAFKLEINSAVQICCDFWISQLSYSSCLLSMKRGDEYQNQSLLESATRCACANFMEIYTNLGFSVLSAEQFRKLLANDDLNAPSEENVFCALKSWVELTANGTDREEHIYDLLTSIRLSLLSPLFIRDHVENFCRSQKCKQLIKEALRLHLLPDRVLNRRRIFENTSSVNLIAISGNEAGSIRVENYCSLRHTWSSLRTHITKQNFSAALLDEKIIIAGGNNSSEILNTVNILNLREMEWKWSQPMHQKRKSFTVSVLAGCLYAIGGETFVDFLNTVEKWNPTTRSWKLVASMNCKRSCAGSAVLGEKIYIVGGTDAVHNSCDTVECYDPHTDEWSFKASMNVRRAAHAVAALNGYLYAIGGCHSTSQIDTVERYDPSTNTWRFVAPLHLARSQINCTVLENRLIVVGGYDGTNILKLTEEYNPEENQWTRLSDSNYPHKPQSVLAVPKYSLPRSVS